MSITLGTKPDTLTLVLARGADFAATLRNTTGAWSPTAVIQLRIDPTTVWTATLSGADAVFAIDAALVDALVTTRSSKVKLFYTDGDSEVCWAIGTIQANG